MEIGSPMLNPDRKKNRLQIKNLDQGKLES